MDEEKTKTKVKKKKKNSLLRSVILIAMLTALIVAAALIADRAQGSPLSGFLSDSDTEFSCNASGSTAFAGVGDSLAALSPLELNVYDRSGNETFTVYCHVSSPAVQTRGSYGVAYDIGGEWLCFFTDKGEIMTRDDFDPIISAAVDETGNLAVCTEDSGYDGMAEIYNSKGAAVYRWHSGSGYVLSATPGGKDFSAVVLAENGSRIVRYALSSEEEQSSWTYNDLVFDIFRSGNGTVAVTREGLIFLNSALEETARYDIGGGYLERYARGDNYTALVVGEHQLDGERKIVIVSDSGEEKASLPAEDSVVGLTADGGYIAVLYPGRAVLYDRALTSRAEKTDLDGAQSICVSRNGRIFTAGLYSANSFKLKPVRMTAASEGGS